MRRIVIGDSVSACEMLAFGWEIRSGQDMAKDRTHRSAAPLIWDAAMVRSRIFCTLAKQHHHVTQDLSARAVPKGQCV